MLRSGAGEAAQDLLGLGGAQLQRGGELDHLVVLLGDQLPPDRACQHRREVGQRVGEAWVGEVEAGGADVLQPRQQRVAEQMGEGEPDVRRAVGVDVVGLDRHLGAMVQQAFHHRRDLGG